MTVATEVRPELTLAKKIMDLYRAENFKGALAAAREGARLYPDFVLPGKGARTKFADLSAVCALKVAQVEAKPEVAKPEVAKPEVQTLRIVHDGENPTSIFGVEKDSPAHRVIGSARNGGLGWRWYGANACFYLPRTGGLAPDMERIREAVAKLEAVTDGQQQMYRVECDIRTVDAAGKPLPLNKAQQAEYDRKQRGLLWDLSVGRGACRCGASGLDVRQGRVVDVDRVPTVKCRPCLGEPMPEPVVESAPEPVVASEPKVEVDLSDLGDLLAIAAEPAPVPAAAECASCHQVIEVKDGEFVPHTRRFNAGACRGRYGVAPMVDVDPEPAQPVRKAQKAQKAQKVESAQPQPQPEAEAESEGKSIEGKKWIFRLEAGMSGGRQKMTATAVRVALNERVVRRPELRGLSLSVFRDKGAGKLSVIVTSAPAADAVNMSTLTAMIKGTVYTVPGVSIAG